MIIGGALMGCAASIREIVKERAIYQREHGIGLSRSAYMFSKLVVLTVITSVQGLILGLLGLVLLPPPDQSVVIPVADGSKMAVAVVAVTVVSMIIGLLISAMIGNADRGMPLLVLVVMAELVLCGGMFGVQGRVPLEYLAWLSPSRWAYAMGASTVDLNDLRRSLRAARGPNVGLPGQQLGGCRGCVRRPGDRAGDPARDPAQRLDPHHKAGK